MVRSGYNNKTMTKLQLRFRQIDRDKYQAIVDGRKTVETRAATPKYRQLATGDELVAVCGQDNYRTTIKRVRHFGSIAALLDYYGIDAVLPGVRSLAEATAIYHSFPGYKGKIKDHGLLALELVELAPKRQD